MKKVITYVVVLVLGAALGLGGTLYAFARHPHLHAALRELDAAREELKSAPHDFGGHREAAIGALDAAHHQIEDCLKFDK
jgi:hypothetical protein